MVQHDDAGWRLAQDAETSVQPRSDEKAILSHVRVLEGARRCRNTGRCLTPTTRSSTPGAPRKRRRSSSPLPKIRKLNSWAAIFIPCVASAVRR
nr:cellulose biosynthesis protein BcsE [Klebsiella pneumoniae]